MPLFFCRWPKQTSVVVDGNDEEHAREIATELGDKVPPHDVFAIPAGVVAFPVAWEESADDPDEEELVIDVLDHVAALFEKYEDAEVCGSEAEDESGAVVRCAREKHEGGKHGAKGLEW